MEAELTKRLIEVLERGLTLGAFVITFSLLVMAGIGVFFYSYLKKAGEQKAIDEKLGEIVKQVRAQAEATEGVRTDFARRLFETTETLKRQFAQEDAAHLRVVSAVADLGKLLGAGAHAISWVTWFAAHSPTELTDARLSDYETEIHATLSKIVGARVLLAAYNSELHASLAHLIESLYALDVAVGEGKALLASNRPAGIAALAALSPRSKEYARRLVSELSSLPQMQPISGNAPLFAQ